MANFFSRFGSSTRASQRRQLLAEELEPRCVLTGLLNLAIDGVGNLLVQETFAGTSNQLEIRANIAEQRFEFSDSQSVFSGTVQGAIGVGTNNVTVPFSAVAGGTILVDTSDGEDLVTVDFSLGEFPQTLQVEGGGQTGDQLVISGGVFGSAMVQQISDVSGRLILDNANTINFESFAAVSLDANVDEVEVQFRDIAEVIHVASTTVDTLSLTSSEAISLNVSTPNESLAIISRGGDDSVNIGDLTTGFGDLVVDSQSGEDTVTLSGDIQFGVNANLNVTGRNIVASGTIQLFGDGGSILNASQDISVQSSASFSSEQGDLQFLANTDATSSGAFIGVWVNGANLTTEDGLLEIVGFGGDAGSGQHGVFINGQSQLYATGAGAIDISGTGQSGDGFSIGVMVTESVVAVNSGLLRIDGTGSEDGDFFSLGVWATSNVNLSSQGTGPGVAGIEIVGQGGGTGSNKQGVQIDTDSQVLSVDGQITITGVGGGETTFSNGIFVRTNATIASTGNSVDTGAVTLNGLGSSGTDNSAGIQIADSTISVNAADLNLIGSGRGTGGSNHGIRFDNGSRIVSAGVGPTAGNITVNGSSSQFGTNGVGVVGFSGFEFETMDGAISIVGEAASSGDRTGVALFGSSTIASSISSTGTGSTAGRITISGSLAGSGDSDRVGVGIWGTSVTTHDGDILVSGTGGDGTGYRNYGVLVTQSSLLESTGTGTEGGAIRLQGTGGAGYGDNHGIEISATSDLRVVDGAIDLDGRGADAGVVTRNYGVLLDNSSIISTGQSADTASLSISGTGGEGETYNYGLHTKAVEIEANAADISIEGIGRGSGLGNNGIVLVNGSSVTSTGVGENAGNISVVGESSLTGHSASGAGGWAAPSFNTVDGDISIVGVGRGDGGGTGTQGVAFYSGTTFTSTGSGPEAGTISITGTGGADASGSIGTRLESSTVVTEDGDVSVLGIGGGDGTGGFNLGIWVNQFTTIESLGNAAEAGKISLEGTGGNGISNNIGVQVNFSDLESAYGDIEITASPSVVTGNRNHGIQITNESSLVSTGIGPNAASIQLNGVAGAGFGNNHGVHVTRSSVLETVDGDVILTGNGQGSNIANFGVYVNIDSLIRSSGTGTYAGNIDIDGLSNSNSFGYGAAVFADALIETHDGAISMTGSSDSTGSTNGGIAVGTNSNVLSLGTAPISLFGSSSFDATSTNGFGIAINAALNALSGEVLLNGNAKADEAAIWASGVAVNAGQLSLVAESGFIREFNNIGIDYASDVLVIDGAISVGGSGYGIMELNATPDFTFGSSVSLSVDGETAGQDLDQIRLLGAGRQLDLANVSLEILNVESLATGSEFVIFDLVDSSSETVAGFAGLAEGSFLGTGNAYFQITYLGGDGNDVSLISANAPPQITLDVVDPISENDFAELRVEVDNPGPVDTLTLEINWGDPRSPDNMQTVTLEDVQSGVSSYTFTHQYLDNPQDAANSSTYIISATLVDDDSGTAADTTSVQVDNVDPSILSFDNVTFGTGLPASPISGVAGQELSFAALFKDAGSLDTHEAVIDWGDGSNPDTVSIIEDGDGFKTLSNHTYESPGAYDVTITVTDNDGGTDVVTIDTVIVNSAILPDTIQQDLLTVYVGGTLNSDDIKFSPGNDSDEVQVWINGNLDGIFTPSGRLVAYGQAGNDDISVAGSISLDAMFDGGEGDDRLKGGAGNDVLLGGQGDDLLVGKNGRDLLVGGSGSDRIVGNADDDILIAGWLNFDNSAEMITAVMEEWTSGASYQQRVTSLSEALVLGETVLDDAEDIDKLTGSSGEDWFFFDQENDRATDLKDEVFANELDWILS